VNLERYFRLERECQLLNRMIAAAEGTVEAGLIDHRSLIIVKAREILQQFDLPAPDWCAAAQPNDLAISRASRAPTQETVPASIRPAPSR
jgi:hypothetical protein